MSRTTGTVKWFSDPKGYGFITDENERDVFVHYTSIEGTGFRSLDEGESVELEIEDTDRGLHARDVTRREMRSAAG